MITFYSKIIGEDPDYTKTFQPSGKRSIRLKGTALLIPVILWTMMGFLITRNVLGESLIISSVTGLFAGLIIFLIERTILMSNGNRWIVLFRVLMGFFIAVLGAVGMDQVIFKNDIDNKIEEYKSSSIEVATGKVSNQYSRKINELQATVNKKESEWRISLVKAGCEADGTCGSGIRGRSSITDLKEDIAIKLGEDYKREKSRLIQLKKESKQAMESARTQAEASFNGNSLLMRIKALHELILSNTYMRIVYIIITALLFLIEFVVIVIKIFNKKSIDEQIEIARDSIQEENIRKILDNKSKYLRPEGYLQNVRNASRLVQDNQEASFRI